MCRDTAAPGTSHQLWFIRDSSTAGISKRVLPKHSSKRQVLLAHTEPERKLVTHRELFPKQCLYLYYLQGYPSKLREKQKNRELMLVLQIKNEEKNQNTQTIFFRREAIPGAKTKQLLKGI